MTRSTSLHLQVEFESASDDADELLKSLRAAHGEKTTVDQLCLQFLTDYESAQKARADEIEMLQRTQHILAGMRSEDSADAVLLQVAALKQTAGGLLPQSPPEEAMLRNDDKDLAKGLASLESMASQLLKQ